MLKSTIRRLFGIPGLRQVQSAVSQLKTLASTRRSIRRQQPLSGGIAVRLTLITLLLAGVVGCDSAADRFHKAAEQGDATAQYRLGHMYAYGDGVPKDEVEAVKWTRKSAAQGCGDAQVLLGNMYGNGKGVPKDEAEGYVWISIGVTNPNTTSLLRKTLSKHVLPRLKCRLSTERLADAEKRVEELTEQINVTLANSITTNLIESEATPPHHALRQSRSHLCRVYAR